MHKIMVFLIFSLLFVTIAQSNISCLASHSIVNDGDEDLNDDESPSLPFDDDEQIAHEDDPLGDTSLDQADHDEFDFHDVEDTPSNLEGGIRRLLSKKKQKATTCNKNPKICRFKGSPGRYCCKKKCVNYRTDRLNCGKCGHKCRFGQMCCKSKCINVTFNKKHCGSCTNRCKKGQPCVHGLCNYGS